MSIILPRIDSKGEYYLSYSQVKLWNDIKGFSTGKPGKHEYMMSYFLGQQFEDKMGFAEFGIDVEDYVTTRNSADKFTKPELKVLNKIKPLGTFQKEIRIDFDGFYLKGFIDDCNADHTHVRDLKTCSEKSKEQYHLSSYKQLDLYALGIKQETGELPKELEVCGIERIGNPYKAPGGRAALMVGENIWYIKREVTDEGLNELKNYIITTSTEISDYYKVFKKLNK